MADQHETKLFPDDNTLSFNSDGLSSPYLFQNSTNNGESILGTIGVYRTSMEDNRSIYHRDRISIYSVYDGHGGYQTSLKAASELSDLLYNNIYPLLNDSDIDNHNIEEIIKDTFREFDRSLLANSDIYMTDGTTVTMVIYIKHINDDTKDIIFFVNLGDSRTVLIQITDLVEMIYATDDHKPTSANEIRRINEIGGSVEYGRVNGALALTRALGDLTYKISDDVYQDTHSVVSTEVDILSIYATPGILILASDGIWDVLTNNDVVSVVTKNSSGLVSNLDNICKMLVTEAVTRGSTDNITVMAIRLY